jgi:hypothetical protein
VVGHPVPVADMGRVMFLEDVFLYSETDIAFLNSFGMRAAFDGVDLFPPREAAFIRSMAPSRIRVLGTVDPPDGASAIESLTYQCETIKIDGLKLYPPGPDARGWVLDDEKNTYPLLEVRPLVRRTTRRTDAGTYRLTRFDHPKDKPPLTRPFPEAAST